ncbi:MAG: c-type cytochrome [Alphaproteobacteria bacterium]|nr:c-type cytochrome [Alphaproteobacteria bacterium]
MRTRTSLLAATALVATAAIGYLVWSNIAHGPETSILNRPWPASVKTDQPDYPPVLTPQEELKTFHMAPGYQVQLVAADPLIKDPILAEFDGDGRLWVVEMQGYAVGKSMENVEDPPMGKIVILQDTDNDGVYDKRTVFIDKLVLPRALKILDKNCALIGEPPNLTKACDTNGDLVADTREVIHDGFGKRGNIEHAANALYWGMDNVINVSEHTYNVLPKPGGKLEIVPNLVRGQWGATQNDAGLLFRDVNTDPLFVDYVPAKYYVRNPGLIRTRGLYENLVDQTKSAVWPVRPTLGVNRGYRPEVSRPDGSSYYYQGVSSPMVFRGDNLPKDVQGDVFVVDDPTNLVHLLKLKDDGSGNLTAGDYYEKGEFLASTDERFRPASLTPGWDGSFLVIDMYRGVSQEERYQTDYLRDYINQHKLWEGVHHGRIFRVVHASGMRKVEKPHMLEETPAQLVQHLSSPIGWWRDTAQQLLVQRNDKSVVPALKDLAAKAPDWRTRLQALWTLEGMGSMDQASAQAALGDDNAAVRNAGVRFAEPYLADPAMLAAVMKLADDPSWQVRRQLAASLGQLPAESRVGPIVEMLRKYGNDEITVDAAVSGLKGQEAEALTQLLSQPGASIDAIQMLAGSAGKNRDVAALNPVLAIAAQADQPEPVRVAVLDGAAAGLSGVLVRRTGGVAGGRAGGGIPGMSMRRGVQVDPLAIPSRPSALETISAGKGDLASSAKNVLKDLTWPGKPKPVEPENTRTPEQEKLYEHGKQVYAANCAGCHQDNGQGAPNVAAALAGSTFVNARPDVAMRILMNGKDGKIGDMPPLGQSLSDEDVAAVLTYVRGTWGNTASPVPPPYATEMRQMYSYRKKPWSNAELQSVVDASKR